MKMLTLKLFALAAFLNVTSAFGSTSYTFNSNSGSNHYSVVITVDSLGIGGTGDLIVQIMNLSPATTNAADTTLISGVFFTLSGTVGSIGSPTSYYSGSSSAATNDPVVNLNKNGTYTTAYSNLSQVSSSVLRWKNLGSGNNIDLTTLTGGQPNQLILGATGGSYNNSVPIHNPTIVGGATFVFANISGISDATTVTNVYFNQGTTASTGNVAGANTETATLYSVATTTAVPEPATASLLGLSFVVVGYFGRRRAGKR